jgi:hypothetical protein
MRKLSALIAILIIANSISFANWHIPVKFQESSSTFKVVKSTDLELDIFASVAGAEFYEVTTKEGKFVKIYLPGFTTSKEAGSPELPLFTKLLEIPHGADINVDIVSSDIQIFDLNKLGFPAALFPYQPSVSKSDDPESLPFHYNSNVYQSNQFTGIQLVTVESLGIMRGVQLGRLAINHFQYNPVTNILEVHNNVVIEISFDNANLAKTKSLKKKYYSPAYDNNFTKLINFKAVTTKELITVEPVKYVIVSDRMFETPLQSFIEWKRKKGFNVIEAYTDQPAVGTSTASIKTYLQGLYTSATSSDPAPSYVLFVGDIQQIPSYNGSATTGMHVSDLYYFTYDGSNDIYPELYYGRFSATNIEELQPQIDKTLEYEKYLMANPAFLDEVVLVAGVDANFAPTHGNGQINYGTDNYFNLAHGLTTHTYLYPASGSSATQIRSDIGNGVSFANYTAHCGSNGWSNPSFSTSHISAMQNSGEYPLMIGNCCLSVKFDDNECFGEALLRAEYKGALGYIGGSNSTYWDEDFWWGVGAGTVSANPSYAGTGLGAFDGMFHENGEALADWYVTNGQIYQAGNLAVTQAGGSETYYWEIYHLMGDPSLCIYMGVPAQLAANHLNAIPVGSATLTVTTEQYAYVAISNESVLLDAQMADATGIVTLSFTALSSVGTLDIVATKQDRAPYISTIDVISSNAPFVVCSSHEINDVNGNNNGYADYTEDILLNVTLENLGMVDATGVYALISTADTCITLLTDSVSGGLIANSSTLVLSGAFQFLVGGSIDDEHTVIFDVTVFDDNGTSWSSNVVVTLYAPKLQIQNIVFDDSVGGNANGRLDPGEVVTVSYEAMNMGHCASSSAIANVSSASTYLQFVGSSTSINNLDVNAPEVISTTFIIDTNTPPATKVDFYFHLEAGYYSCSDEIKEPVGLIAEDWESETFTMYNWDNSGTYPWVITSATSIDGIYSAASADIGSNQSSVLEISIQVAVADSISFYKRVSCEAAGGSYYDYLQFSIDNVEQDKWAGEIDWSKEAYPIDTGMHTLKWKYLKDSYLDDGEDKAWIDEIVFPNIATSTSNNPPTIDSQADTLTEKYEIYTYDVVASDQDGDNITLICAQKPDFLTFTDNGLGSGTLSGTPGQNDDGVYPVIISAYDGIVYAPQFYELHVEAPSEIKEFGNKAELQIYPNPTTDYTDIQINLSENSRVGIKLINTIGEQIEQIKNSEYIPAGILNHRINLKHLNAGIYYVEITIGDRKLVEQIVKSN